MEIIRKKIGKTRMIKKHYNKFSKLITNIRIEQSFRLGINYQTQPS